MSGRTLRGTLAWLLMLITLGFLIVISVLIVALPSFPLNIGFVQTVGRAGLVATLVPAIVGIVGLVQLRRRGSLGARLVAAYCGFWAIAFLAGLPQVWNAKRSFCLKGLNFCITSPWVARLTVLAIALPFLLCAWWAVREARAVSPDRAR